MPRDEEHTETVRGLQRGTLRFEMPLTDGKRAVILLPPVTEEEWALMMSVLNAAKPSFVTLGRTTDGRG